MIKHIVMVKLQNRSDKGLSTLSRKILSLKDKIEVLQELELGVDFVGSERSMDLVLLATFSDREALETYRTHPEHIPVLEYIREIGAETKVVDYEY